MTCPIMSMLNSAFISLFSKRERHYYMMDHEKCLKDVRRREENSDASNPCLVHGRRDDYL
jgi:hypothetical protein